MLIIYCGRNQALEEYVRQSGDPIALKILDGGISRLTGEETTHLERYLDDEISKCQEPRRER